MRILLLTQFFPPEMGAPAARFWDFARYAVGEGHHVEVVTGMPSFPSGVVHAGYRGALLRRETLDGVHVVRTWLWTSTDVSLPHKAANQLSFMLSGASAAIGLGEGCDVVVATVPPPTVGLAALVTARALGRPLVLDVRDIWPEAVIQSGRIADGMAIRALDVAIGLVYRHASAVVTVTDGKAQRLRELVPPRTPIAVVPNGVDIASYDAPSDPWPVLQAHGLTRAHLLVTYAGVFNPAQGLDVVLACARRFGARSEHAHVRFVLVGAGAMAEALRAVARRERLDNVVFLPEQPRAAVPGLQRASAVNLVTLRPRRDLHTVPSKLFECLASGRPVAVSADGEAIDIATRSGGAVCAPAGDADAFDAALSQLVGDADLRARLGAEGSTFVRAHYDRLQLNASYLDCLARVVEARGRP